MMQAPRTLRQSVNDLFRVSVFDIELSPARLVQKGSVSENAVGEASAASAGRMNDKCKFSPHAAEAERSLGADRGEGPHSCWQGAAALDGEAKPSITAAMPGKVLKPGTLKRVAQEGLALLGSRLNESRVPTR